MKKICFSSALALCVAVSLWLSSCEVPAYYKASNKEVLVRLKLEGGEYNLNGETLKGQIDFRGAPGTEIYYKKSDGSLIPFGYFDMDKLSYEKAADQNIYKRLSGFRCSDSKREWDLESVNDFFVTHFPYKNTTYTAEWENLPPVKCSFYSESETGGNNTPWLEVKGTPGEPFMFRQTASNNHLELTGDDLKSDANKSLNYSIVKGSGIPTVFPLKHTSYTNISKSDFKFTISGVNNQIQLKEQAVPNTGISQEGQAFTWTGGPGGGWNTASQIHTTGNKVSTLVIPKTVPGISASKNYYVEIKFNFCGNDADGYRPKILICDADSDHQDYAIAFMYLTGEDKVGVGIVKKNGASFENTFINNAYLEFPNFASFRTKNQAQSEKGMSMGGYMNGNKAFVSIWDGSTGEEWAAILDLGSENILANAFSGSENVKVTFDKVASGSTDIVLDRVAFYEVTSGSL